MTYTPSLQSNPSLQERSKVSPAKALQQAMVEQRSGRIVLNDPNDPSLSWCVYFGGGQIHFAESTMGQPARLPYLLRKFLPKLEVSAQFDQVTSDYPFLCQYWQSQQLSLQDFRKVLALFTQEALIQFLAIPQGYLQFESKIGLDPLLLAVPFKQIILPVREQISQWGRMRTFMSSPFQRPFIRDRDRFLEMVWQATESVQKLQELTNLLDDNLCLYELASCLCIEAGALALQLEPLIQAGSVGIHPYGAVAESVRPVVACVDDSQTIQQFVKLALESSGYDVLSLLDPTTALPSLIKHQPIVILMDIEMPKIDGYELCQRLRQESQLKAVPVIMLTGRDGIVDRIRARMVGCTAYLNKPFNPQELLSLVQKQAEVAQAAATL